MLKGEFVIAVLFCTIGIFIVSLLSESIECNTQNSYKKYKDEQRNIIIIYANDVKLGEDIALGD